MTLGGLDGICSKLLRCLHNIVGFALCTFTMMRRGGTRKIDNGKLRMENEAILAINLSNMMDKTKIFRIFIFYKR